MFYYILQHYEILNSVELPQLFLMPSITAATPICSSTTWGQHFIKRQALVCIITTGKLQSNTKL